jgi:hypothetical protein
MASAPIASITVNAGNHRFTSFLEFVVTCEHSIVFHKDRDEKSQKPSLHSRFAAATWKKWRRRVGTSFLRYPDNMAAPSSSLPRVRPLTDGPERDHLISARHPRKNQTDRGCAMEVLRPPEAGLASSKIRRLTFAPQPGRPCHVTLPVRHQPLGLALAQSAAAASTALRRHPKHAVAALATNGRCR